MKHIDKSIANSQEISENERGGLRKQIEEIKEILETFEERTTQVI